MNDKMEMEKEGFLPHLVISSPFITSSENRELTGRNGWSLSYESFLFYLVPHLFLSLFLFFFIIFVHVLVLAMARS